MAAWDVHAREDLVLSVLTTPQLFRLVSQWDIRWPPQLVTQWRAFQRVLDEREAARVRNGFPIAKARAIELFVRELMLTGDAETLRLAAHATWKDMNTDQVRAFPIKDLQFAVRGGHAETLRVAFAFATTQQDWLWKEAIDHFPGHCGVLDVMNRITKPSRRTYEFYRDTCKIAAVVKWLTRQLEPKRSSTAAAFELPPPAKRARRTPVTLLPPGDAAFRVITNRQLFLLLPQWMDGWPTELLQRWRVVSSRTKAADALRVQRGFEVPKKRKVELFMRELMLDGDIATLRLAVACTWQDDRTQTKHAFPVTDLQFAVRSRHAETVRFAFEHRTNRAAFSFDKIVWFWREALTHFPGHCRVFEVLMEFAPPPQDILAICDLNSVIEDVPTTRWFVDHLGAPSLPSSAILHAAERGDLPLVQYLSSVPGQDVALAVSWTTHFTPSVCVFLQTLGTN